MALLGKSFSDYVDKQVKIRQKSLGGPSLTSKTLKVYNSQSPWIRLASSVNITAGDTTLPGKSVLEQVKDLFDGFEYVGDKLAKNFVLFGGVNTEKGGVENMPTGINKTPLKSAYGFGYKDLNRDNSRGYVPMPGIESVDFSYKNDGALAQASIQIKCFSPEQFQMVDILFQRPGYTVLLEFGHSVFKDNEGKVQYAGQGDYSYETEPFSNLYNPKEKQGFYNLLDLIQVEKEKWDGNYEAFYAKITKFNWKFNSDGSYNITVNLIGLGDVISSLKMDVTPPKIPIQGDDNLLNSDTLSIKNSLKVFNQEDNPFIPTTRKDLQLNTGISGTFRSSFVEDGRNGFVYYVKRRDNGVGADVFKIDKKDYIKNTFTLSESPTIQNSLTSAFTYELRRIKEEMKEKIKQKTTQDDTISSYTSSTPYPYTVGNTISKDYNVTIPKGVLGIITGNKEHDPGTYISFGVLLSIIQQYCNQYSKGIPILQFDFNFTNMKEDNNYIKKYSGLFSSDPTKVLVPYKQLPINIIGDSKPLIKPSTNKNKGISFNDPSILESSPFLVSGDTNKGRLAYVFLHTDYLSTKFVESVGSNNTGLPILDFLKDVLKDIDNNLNNLNNFKILHNKETNKIEIVSETPIGKTTSNVTIINTFGVTKTEGSFVRDLSLDSELSDNYATQISVGAQNNGLNSQSNGLSFSTYNKGLIDRMIPEKNDNGSIKNDTPSTGSNPPEPQTWGNIWTPKTLEVFTSVYVNYNADSETLSSLKSLNSSISNLVSGELTKKSLAPPPMFLPFNLKLTMDGLSGMRIYDSFEIDGKVLPASYNPEQIQLTIKSLSHKVDTNGWSTQVETFCQPKFIYDHTNIKVGEVPYVSITELIYGEDPPFWMKNSNGKVAPGGGVLRSFDSPIVVKKGEDPAPIINVGKVGSTNSKNTPTYKANKLNLRPIKKASQIHQLAKEGKLTLIGDASTNSHFAKVNNPRLQTVTLLGGKYYLAPAPAKAFKKWMADLDKNKIPYLITSAVRFGGYTGGGPHGYGVAVDFNNLVQLVGNSTSPKLNKKARIENPIYRQIAEVGARYGWYNPWRLSDNLGKDELWHFEYWGSAVNIGEEKLELLTL